MIKLFLLGLIFSFINHSSGNTGYSGKELKFVDNVAFRAYTTADRFFAAYSNINFDAEEFDEGGNFTPGPLANFTAPSDGVYTFQAGMVANNLGSGFQVSVMVNTIPAVSNIIRPSSLRLDVSHNLCFTLKLRSRDVVRVWVQPITEGVTLKNGKTKTWWSGFKVQ